MQYYIATLLLLTVQTTNASEDAKSRVSTVITEADLEEARSSLTRVKNMMTNGEQEDVVGAFKNFGELIKPGLDHARKVIVPFYPEAEAHFKRMDSAFDETTWSDAKIYDILRKAAVKFEEGMKKLEAHFAQKSERSEKEPKTEL